MPGILFMYLYQNHEICLFVMVMNVHTAWQAFCYLFLWYHTVIAGAAGLQMEIKWILDKRIS